jgi:hypothetical protein
MSETKCVRSDQLQRHTEVLGSTDSPQCIAFVTRAPKPQSVISTFLFPFQTEHSQTDVGLVSASALTRLMPTQRISRAGECAKIIAQTSRAKITRSSQQPVTEIRNSTSHITYNRLVRNSRVPFRYICYPSIYVYVSQLTSSFHVLVLQIKTRSLLSPWLLQSSLLYKCLFHRPIILVGGCKVRLDLRNCLPPP